MARYIKVTLYLEPGVVNGRPVDAAYIESLLMRPAFAPGDEPTPVCNIPAIGDCVYQHMPGSDDEQHLADIAGIEVEDEGAD